MDRTEESLFKRILIATDGSENAEKAASHAINIAKEAGSELYALYVISTKHSVTTRSVKGWTDEFEAGLENRGRTAIYAVEYLGKESGIRVKPVFSKGIPAEEILEYAEKNDIDLIVMGTKGLTGIEKFLMGSVTENVIRHSRIPVMVVR